MQGIKRIFFGAAAGRRGLTAAALLISLGGAAQQRPDRNTILEFMTGNPDRFSIIFTRNDSTLAEARADTSLPLASTVKVVIAVEYAYQAARGILDPSEMVSLGDLDRFYVPNTDGGAHGKWLGDVKEKVVDGKVPLSEVAAGMISRSSNANTEWLLEKLNPDSVNARVRRLGLQSHTPVYYITSAIFTGKEAYPLLRGRNLQLKLRATPSGSFASHAASIHMKLKADSTYKTITGDLSMDVQKILSDKLPAASARDYHQLMRKLNSRTYFPAEVHAHLDPIMEFLMTNPANAAWLAHAGMKGGSTAFTLSKALYATDKKGNRTELVYFMHNLNPTEAMSLTEAMNDFELNMLTNGAFRNSVGAVTTVK